MNKQRRLAFIVKSVLMGSLLSLSTLALADDKNYKGENSSPPPARKIYKGEEETTDYASNYVPNEGKYGGQVYTSDLYQGPVEGPGYNPAETRSLHDGFYVGIEAGYDSYKMRTNINTMAGGISVFQQTPDLDAVGLSYTLVGGYGRVFDNPLYLGAEVYYNNSQANTSQNVGILNGQVGIYNIKSLALGSYGLSLTPGVKLGDTALLFLKGGYTRVEAKTYETSAFLGVNNAQSNGVNGINFGLGFEVDMYKNWSVRGEYTHVNCENFTTRVGTRITPSNNQFMFGVFFHLV